MPHSEAIQGLEEHSARAAVLQDTRAELAAALSRAEALTKELRDRLHDAELRIDAGEKRAEAAEEHVQALQIRVDQVAAERDSLALNVRQLGATITRLSAQLAAAAQAPSQSPRQRSPLSFIWPAVCRRMAPPSKLP